MTTETLKRQSSVAPVPARRRLAYKGLQWFHDTPKTESAMYIRFQTLPKASYDALTTFYHCTTDIELFSLICKWWCVKQA